MTKADKELALADLRNLLKPKDIVYVVLRHVTRSRMSQAIDLYVIRDNEPRRITWSVAVACGYTYSERYDALVCNAVGLDAGRAVVYDLSCTIFKSNGFAGYALRREWL